MAQPQTVQLSDTDKALIFTWYSNFDISYADLADAFTQHTGKYMDRYQAEAAHHELSRTFDNKRKAPEWAMYYGHKRNIPLGKVADLEANLVGARSILIETTRAYNRHRLERILGEVEGLKAEHDDILIKGLARSQQYAERLGVLKDEMRARKASVAQAMVRLEMIGEGWPQRRHWLKRG
ncbi:MAG: hypothetical protein Q9183_003465 [Haloplaca sp. 2 TL-2023]